MAGLTVGATVSSTSPEFSDDAIISRFGQLEPKILIAAASYEWKGKKYDQSEVINSVISGISSIEILIIVGTCDLDILNLRSGIKIIQWGDLPLGTLPIDFTRRPFDHPAFALFTSGTTGKPKGLLHRSGGLLLKHLVEQGLHCDIRPGDRVSFYTTTGWMMWNWEISVLATGANLIVFDGAPNYPDLLRLFYFAKEQRLTHLGLSARLLDVMCGGGYSPKSLAPFPELRVLMVTGSPLSEATARWISNELGQEVLIAPFSGGTDIAGSFIGPDPLTPFHPGQMQGPMLGMDFDIFDDNGHSLKPGKIGELVCKQSFPTVPLGIWNDNDGSLFRSTYFYNWPGVWIHGDLASRTEQGGVIIHGRSDATLNISGVRIGTGEIYAALSEVHEVIDSLAVSQPWDGDERIILLVITSHLRPGAELKEKIRENIKKKASPRHLPSEIFFVSELPRTFNGKLSEIAVADLTHRRVIRNLSSIANPQSLTEIEAILSLN